MNWLMRLLCRLFPTLAQKEIDADIEHQKAAYKALVAEWDTVASRHHQQEVRRVS